MTTMTRGVALPTVTGEAHSPLTDSLLAFARNPLFTGEPDVLHGPNPYRRMLTPDALAELDFSRPLAAPELNSFRALAGHRMLGTFYEAETVLLPEQGLNALRDDFDLFYSEGLRQLRESSLSDLERFAFSYLADDVDVPGNWSIDALDAYFHHVVAEADASDTAALVAIEASPRPEVAADTYLVQLALDGLTEASAMSRNLAGAYGPEQSALFKIFIDEFGYGVYEAKHTSIFSKMLRSRAMATHVHAYWNFYLAGPLATNNFYYYLSRDHAKFFRYAGAVTYAERVFAPGFVKMIRTYRGVFGDEVDLHYCEEHAHIDQHHGRITREQLLLALAERHGPSVIPELVRGIAEARVVGRWFDEDTAEQIRWADAIEAHRGLGERAMAGASHPRSVEITPASPVGTRSHDQATVVVIDSGEADLITTATGTPDRMARGDVVLVPAGRTYALKAVSPSCTYRMFVAPAEA
jgi:Iron-containing redox enzyme